MNRTESTLVIDSPIGGLAISSNGAALTRIDFVRPPRSAVADQGDALLREAARQLRAYFAGALAEFDLPLDPTGTEFQRRVWKALCAIPWGQTVSYTEMARRVGQPTATRAVGAANGRNPIAIVIPCHRVIGANGSLTGYGGGLPIKRWLLAHEGADGNSCVEGSAAVTVNR